jgi:hypothetical protein
MQKIDRSITKEYFELDLGGQRFTHYPSGDTCLKYEWMNEHRNRQKWVEKVTAFFAKHADVSVVVNSKYEIIDDANAYPFRGADFNVGDTVLARVCTDIHRDDWGMCARTITEREDFEGDKYVDPYTVFKLDDGGEFWWDEHNNGWFLSASKSPDGQSRRVRPPMEGEEILTLTEKKEAAAQYRF